MRKSFLFPLLIPSLFLGMFPLQASPKDFFADRKTLEKYASRKDLLIVASSGLSGSTMLTETLSTYASDYMVVKMHLLPPDHNFKGKIIFIYSDPDKAAESVLHNSLINRTFGFDHFKHVETADVSWLHKIKDTTKQTERINILAYDVFGYGKQLKHWLYKTKACPPNKASILAIKYEHLWDYETLEAIREFLKLPYFALPERKKRGHNFHSLDDKEKRIRLIYNLGTIEEPRYAAYDEARKIWESSPPFQYYKISP